MIYQKEGIEIIDLGDDDGTVVFNSETGETAVFNSVAADIFQCYSEYHNIEDVILQLSKIYNEPEDFIRSDILSITDQLLDLGILVKPEETL